jgi:hypothetical protein
MYIETPFIVLILNADAEYIKVDPGYGDLKDPFVIAQTWYSCLQSPIYDLRGNVIEMVFNVVTIILVTLRPGNY